VVTWRKGYPFILESRSHPNIVKFYDFIETEKNYYFVSEYCEGPTLEELISKKAKIDEATALIWLKGLASAVSYLHS
jgi:serine/threonine-protein kinase ULK/ATG1